MHRLLSVCSNLGLQVPALPNLVVTLDDEDGDDASVRGVRASELVPLADEGGSGVDGDDDDCQITDMRAAGSLVALAPAILGQIPILTSMGPGQQQQHHNASATRRSSFGVRHDVALIGRPSSQTSASQSQIQESQQTDFHSQSQSQSTANREPDEPQQQLQLARLRSARTPKSLSKLLNANKQLVAARKRQLLEMPQADLAKLCFDQTLALKRQQVSNNKQNNQIRSLKRKVGKMEKDMAKLTQRTNDKLNTDSFQVCKRGKQRSGRGGRFTVSSWFSIGIRKGLTQIAASDFGLATMCDISGQTVLRSEARTGAGIIHLFQMFMAEALDYAASCGRTADLTGDSNSQQLLQHQHRVFLLMLMLHLHRLMLVW